MQHQPITGTSSEQVLCEPTPVLSQLMQYMPTTCTSSSQVHREPDPLSSGQTQVVLQPDKGRKITFDNFDIYQEVHHMTEQNQNKDKHYVTVMSTENQVSGSHLRCDGPICDIAGLENGKCVPDHNDHLMQKNDYVVLVARIITANIQCLKHLDEVVTKHILHRYQKETAQATDTTFLGVLYHNENSTDGILEILKELHSYVPFAGDDENMVYADQGVVGDQLTVERAVNGHASLSNGFTAEEWLEGLHFEIADWHAGNKFLQVAFDCPYSQASSRDKCTMYSNCNLINRRNVKARVDSAVKPARSFFLPLLDSKSDCCYSTEVTSTRVSYLQDFLRNC